MLLQSLFHQLFFVKFAFKLVTFYRASAHWHAILM